MQDVEAPQRYLEGISLQSDVVAGLLARAGADGATLAPFVEPRAYAAGEVMIEQGSRPDALLLVLRGAVTAVGAAQSVVTGKMSEAVELNRLGRFDVLGEVSWMTRQPATATLTAQSPVEALALAHSAFSRLMRASPLTSVALMRSFAENIVEKIRTTHGVRPALAPGLKPGATELPPHPSMSAEGVADALLQLRAIGWSEAEARSGAAELLTAHRVRGGQRFVVGGERSDALFFLVSGTARTVGLDGLPREFVGGSDRCDEVLIGEMAFLRGHRREADVVAATDCDVLALAAGRELELADRSPGFTGRLHLALLRAVCGKLVETSEIRARALAAQGGDWEQWFVDA